MQIGGIVEILKFKFGEDFYFALNGQDSEIKTLLTDSRNHFKPEGTLFFAIKTPGGNDGHNYIGELYEKGVRNFIVNKGFQPQKLLDPQIYRFSNFFFVPDSIEALTEIGRQHRKRAKKVVAITGSRGKTTFKEMIFQLLESKYNISRSPRSFNSKIGVPLSLWQILPDTDLAIIEAGVSQKGEMKRLADAIEPDIVIITNIGEEHSQGFTSMQEKAREKALLAFSPNIEKVYFPENNPILEEALKEIPEEKKYRFSQKEIQEAFRNLHPVKTRLNVSDGINGCSVILDSYTSDLSSLLPAIDFMMRRKMPSQTPVLIISDLRHEGKDVSLTYQEIARLVKETRIPRFIGIGDTLKSFSYLFPNQAQFFSSTEEFLQHISASDFNDEIILLKGAPEFEFEKIHELLEAKKHETVLEVNLDAIIRNYNYFKSKIPSGTGIIAMVKAQGYGAGSYEIAKTLQDAGASYLAVAALDEGIDLRKNGITMPIMVMNPKSANYRSLFKNNLEPVIYSLSMLEGFIKEVKKYGISEYPVHIKLDTGMHRTGFEEKDLQLLVSKLNNEDLIKVATIFSHLATADCLDMDDFTLTQFNRFERMSSFIIQNTKKNRSYTPKRHILNSAGILRFPEFHYDYVRLGIGLYGANTLPPDIEKPLAVVSTLRTVVISIREIDGNEAVGYGRKGKISGKTKIATIPVGYADGMNRHFGNGAIKVLVNGHKVPTIGNICMDATMLDVSEIDCKEGDAVEIFGENMSLQDLADTLDTIPYEILTSVSPRVKRIYYRE